MKIIPPLRGFDAHGSGAFGAPRGKHTHNGIDFACAKGSKVLSICDGEVTKLGYPYPPTDEIKGHLRYVQITDINSRVDVRYFYVLPSVKVGDKIAPGDEIGETQGLLHIYKGITDHYHFEIKQNGVYLDPHDYINSLGG